MKRIVLCLLLVLGTFLTLNANDVVSKPSVSIVKDSVSHWSAGFRTGFNYFRVYPPTSSQLDQVHLIFGLNAEYTINPLLGFGVEYLFNPYSRPYYWEMTNFIGKLKGGTNDVVLISSINLTNLLTPFRGDYWDKINVYGNTGFGLGLYYYSLDGKPVRMSISPISTFGLNVEYNYNKEISLGAEAQYRYYDRPNLGGAFASRGNCDALIATISLRYKFGLKSNKTNIRNIGLLEYYPKPTPVIIKQTVDKEIIDQAFKTETINRLNSIEQKNDTIKSEMLILKNGLSELATIKEGIVSASFPNIEFRFGSDNLTKESFPVLDNIISLLKENTWSKVAVIGNTDNVGDADVNQALSEIRAKVVRNYLVAKGIPIAKIIYIGYGESKPVATNSTLEGRRENRRVEFKVKK